jgi:heme oxygenase
MIIKRTLEAKRDRIIQNISDAHILAVKALEELREENDTENGGDKQFDYVTSPKLANMFDNLKWVVNRMEKIIYQEGK